MSPPAAGEFALTFAPRPGEGVGGAFGRLARELRDRKATLLSLMVLGPVEARREGVAAMAEHLGPVDWPVTWIDGADCGSLPIAGLQAFAVSGAKVRRIVLGGRIVGSVYEDGGARHCLLGGLTPRTTVLPPHAQASQVLGDLEAALADAGLDLGDVVRTWFYNDDLLSWYDDFNRVRTACYSRHAFRSGSLPASTGISARNPEGAALVAGAFALRPLGGAVRAIEVGSPLQCPAPAYGSSFSRAVEIAAPGRRTILVSGTASIAQGGRSMWIGDAPRQVERTMEVVEAILRSRGFTFADTTRAIAYFKHPGDAPAFDAWCASRKLDGLPAIRTRCGICRDDLLFEIELDACVSGR